ncbi:MAG: hypothetical protein K2L80_07220, partial [Muribaculaceae bacterium]|nr:hypothetical protein [Muribaculaceae bacterium]
MKQRLHISATVFLAAACGAAYAYAAPLENNKEYFRYSTAAMSGRSICRDYNTKGLYRAPIPGNIIDGADNFTFLDGPDGTTWFCYTTCSHNGNDVSASTTMEFTVYDSEFRLVGKVKHRSESEPTVKAIEISPVVTRAFFNSDDNFEIIVGSARDCGGKPTDYVSHVYSIGGMKDDDGFDMPLSEINGYTALATSGYNDRKHEIAYLGFISETYGDNAGDEAGKYRLIIYRNAGDEAAPAEYAALEVDTSCVPGDNSAPFATLYNHNGNIGLAFSRYEKPLLSESDNSLVIELFSFGEEQLIPVQTTKIPSEPGNTPDKATFFSIGTFRINGDINIGDIDPDNPDRAAFIVTRESHDPADNSISKSLAHYDADGRHIRTICDDMDVFVLFNDIKGFEPQCLFIGNDSGGDRMMHISDIYSGNTLLSIPQNLEGLSLSANANRIAKPHGYIWAFECESTYTGDETTAKVAWIDTDGQIARIDENNLGPDVESARLYPGGTALSPFLFNSDTAHEYMYLVKRRNGATPTAEDEFIVVSPDGNTLLATGSDNSVEFMDAGLFDTRSGLQLGITFRNRENGQYTQEFHALPLESFAGGEGTMANPYRIAEPGDILLIGKEPMAHYILSDNIDMAGIDTAPFDGIFTGTVDGRGKFIHNLTITSDAASASLLGKMRDGASVKNLNFTNACIKSGAETTEIALLSADANGAIIENVHVYGIEIQSGLSSGAIAGALIANAGGNTMAKASSVVNARIENSGTLTGGIIGNAHGGTSINACAFTGSINGRYNAGGIAARLHDAESNIYN